MFGAIGFGDAVLLKVLTNLKKKGLKPTEKNIDNEVNELLKKSSKKKLKKED